MIICFSGKKRTGKDTATEYLMQKFNAKQYAFADMIKKALYKGYVLTNLTFKLDYKDFYEGGNYDRDNFILPLSHDEIKTWLISAVKFLDDYCERISIDDTFIDDVIKNKSHFTIRTMMQLLGTDIVCSKNPMYWINLTINKINQDQPTIAIISDMRFDEEAQTLRKLGAKIIFIQRDTGLVDDHISEAGIAIQSNDIVILNNGTLQDFYTKLGNIYDSRIK